MAIMSLSAATAEGRSLTCAICGLALTPDKATAGNLDAEGRQAFACVAHFLSIEKLIVGWADFAAREHQKSIEPDLAGNQLCAI